MNFFIRVLNFIFPREKIQATKIKKLLENRIIYFPIKHQIIFLPYKNSYVRDAIWSMKFKNNFSISTFFSEMIYENLPNILQDLSLSENFIDPILINIPISTLKKMDRGYNQNDRVIQSFIKQGGSGFISWEKNILIKTKDTKPQSRTENRNERLENIKNSFGIKNPEKIQGKNILLFDDVLTTGATLNEAKKVLMKAGAKKVITMTLAH